MSSMPEFATPVTGEEPYHGGVLPLSPRQEGAARVGLEALKNFRVYSPEADPDLNLALAQRQDFQAGVEEAVQAAVPAYGLMAEFGLDIMPEQRKVAA